MGSAVVDATSGAEGGSGNWVVTERAPAGSHSHRSQFNGSYRAERQDVKAAMRYARGGSSDQVRALVALRPESRRPDPIFSWRHRTIAVRDDQQIDVAQLLELRQLYEHDKVAEMDASNAERWRNMQGMRLAENKVGDAMDRVRGRTARTNHGIYGMVAVRAVAGGGFLAADNQDEFDDLIAAINNYDRLRQRRDILETKIEATASRGVNRPFMLGASAVRSLIRALNFVVDWPSRRVYLLGVGRGEVTEKIIRKSRRAALLVKVGMLVVGGSLLIYNNLKGAGHHPDATIAGGGSSQNTVDPHPTPTDMPTHGGDHDPVDEPPDQPTTVDPPDSGEATGDHVVFSQDAQTTRTGEGWMSQFSQMHIRYTGDFMDKLGPMLEAKGYAYKYFDHSLNQWQWGMNLKDIDPDTLQQIYKAAKEQGLVTSPLPLQS